jgi:predicted permease
MLAWAGSWWADVRFALRLLRRSPGFAAVGILTLGLGIGANTAMFSVVDSVLLKSLPFPKPDRLTALWEAQKDQSRIFISYRDVMAFQRENHSFEAIAGETWVGSQRTLRGHGAARTITAIVATPNLFTLLRANPSQGRTFTPADGDACLLVLSDRGWRSDFGRDPRAVGSAVSIDNRPCTVIGIMPPDLGLYPREATLWLVPEVTDRLIASPKEHLWAAIGRLKAGVSLDAARSELAAIRENVDRADPDRFLGVSTVVLPLQEEYVWLAGQNLASGLKWLMAAVLIVLLVACLNLANLLLARTAERRRELAVRTALGGSTARVLRQLLIETLVLAALGALAGMGLAMALLRFFALHQPIALPPGGDPHLDLRVLAFTTAVAAIAAVVCSLLPARVAAHTNLDALMRQSGRGTTARAPLAGALVIAQITFSVALLVAAALLGESILRMATAPMGFDSSHLLAFGLDLTTPAYPANPQRLAFTQRALGRLQALPDVTGAAACNGLPLYNNGMTAILVEGQSPLPDEFSMHMTSQAIASPDYFRVAGIPLLAGRTFDTREQETTAPAVIVNQALLRRYFSGSDPASVLGRHIRFGPDSREQRWLTIVGVVADVKQADVFTEMQWAERPIVYRAFTQAPQDHPRFLLSTRGDPQQLAPLIPGVVSELDPALTVRNLETADEALSRLTAQPRFRAVLSLSFAALAFFVAVLGLYGVLARLVAQRTQEIGIRMALGAQASRVQREVLWRGMTLALAGIGCGILAALAMGRYLSAFLFNVSATNLTVLVAVAASFGLVALIACYLPARRATRVDPMIALRAE